MLAHSVAHSLLTWHHREAIDGSFNCCIQPPPAKDSDSGTSCTILSEEEADVAFLVPEIRGRCDLANTTVYLAIPSRLVHNAKLAPRPQVKGKACRLTLQTMCRVGQIPQYGRFFPWAVCRNRRHINLELGRQHLHNLINCCKD